MRDSTYRRRRVTLAAAFAALVATTGSASGTSAPQPFVVLYSNNIAVHAKTSSLERQLGFESTVRFALREFRGFQASLTADQAAELRRDPDVVAVHADPAVYLFGFARGVDVDGRTQRLERLVGFRSELRYRRLVRGFAARLSLRQALTVAVDTAFDRVPEVYFETFVTAEGMVFVVLYDRRVWDRSAAKTDALARRLGLELRFRYDAAGGFSAPLSATQLHALTEDEEISHILYNWRSCGFPPCAGLQDPPPPATARLRATRAVRQALRSQLLGGNPSLRGRVGALRRVHLARSAGTVDYAAATFRVGGTTRTDLFRRHVAGGWLWIGRSPGYVCTDRREPSVPPDVVAAWGLQERLGSGCFRFPRR